MEDVKPVEGMLPALARAVSEAFPELEGRSIAVSEIDPFNRTNVPTLPIAIVALIREVGRQSRHGGGNIDLEGEVIVQVVFKTVKYKKNNEAESPFFAYYDYESIRDRMLAKTSHWRSPRNIGLEYKGMDVESDEYGVWVSFRFGYSQKWCPPQEEDPLPAQISFRILEPKSVSCEPCPEEPDPCFPTA